MARWGAYGQLDNQLRVDGDRRFIGLDMTRDRALLGPGILAVSNNKRLRNGSADTRKGNILPADFTAPFTNIFLGSGVYCNPNGDELMLVAEAKATFVWGLQYGKDPIQIKLAAGENLTGVVGVRFCQAFDKVLLFRRNPVSGHQTLEWNGNTDQSDTNNYFKPVALSAGGGTDTVLIPITTDGEPFQSRVLLYNACWPSPVAWDHTISAQFTTGRDQMVMTEILDYTRTDPVYSVFRINAGESDYITRIWPYYNGAVVIFKKNTTHLLGNFTLDATNSTQGLLSKRMGLAGPNAIVEDGNDLLFLSEPGGIYRLSEIIQEQIGAQPLPVSDPIQPIIDQIDWNAARDPRFGGGARFETLGNYQFFALPVGKVFAGVGNNTLAVFNSVTKQWESIDTWPVQEFTIHAMHVTQYQGGRALFALDYANKNIYVLYQSEAYDEIANDIWPIEDAIETRGYTCDDPGSFKRFSRAPIAIRTSNPEVYISAISDGVNEVKPLTPAPIVKHRNKFYQHGHPDFVASGDPLEPKREDYSQADVGDFAGEDFEDLPIGPISVIPASFISEETGPRQESVERLSVRVNARWVSLRIENKSGTCDVLSVGIEATRSAMETKTAA